MNNSLQVFSKDNFLAHAIQDETGNIWFVAKYVAQALEYSESTVSNNIRNLLQSVPDMWKGNKRFITPGGEQDVLCLTEQGLYFFLGRSDKPKALPYQMWIARDVVPSILHTGSYSLNKEKPALSTSITDSAKIIFEAAGIKGNQLALALDKVVEHYTGESMLALSGVILEAPTKTQLLTPTDIGKHFGVSARKVNKLLCSEGYQKREGKNYEPLEAGEPYAVMLDTNKWHSDGTPIRQLKWESAFLTEIEDLFS